MSDIPDVSIVIPLYNEEAGFATLIERLVAIMDVSSFGINVILIDDGSTDGTRGLITDIANTDPRFIALILSKNHGHQLAISAGMNYVNASKGVMIIDSDLQDPPELIVPWFELLTEQHYDVIYGVRSMRDDEGNFKKITSKSFYKILNWLTSEPIPLDSGDFCMMSVRVVNLINAMPERYRFVRGMRASIGFKQKAYPYERQERTAGETKYTFKKMTGLALDALYGFSDAPYRMMMNLGIGLIGLSTAYLLYSYVKSVLFGTVVSGFLGLLGAIILIGGINLLGLGILGGYIVRNFFELKSRPLFIVDEIIEDQQSTRPQYEK